MMEKGGTPARTRTGAHGLGIVQCLFWAVLARPSEYSSVPCHRVSGVRQSQPVSAWSSLSDGLCIVVGGFEIKRLADYHAIHILGSIIYRLDTGQTTATYMEVVIHLIANNGTSFLTTVLVLFSEANRNHQDHEQ